MIEDARRLAHLTRLTADVVIVGSGPAGLALAQRFLGSGLDVLVIEAGGRGDDTGPRQAHWADGGEAAGPHPPLHLFRRRVFGGTSTVWGGRCVPFDPADFVPQPGIRAQGWPISFDEVARYYPQALALLDAGACAFEADRALPEGMSRLVADAGGGGLDLAGIERFSRPTNVAHKFRRALASSRNVRVLLNAACTEVTTTRDGQAVTGVRCRVTAGRELAIAAPVVVLANGGIESVRLLLASDAVMAGGLGNARDIVGRYYMTHLTGECGRLTTGDRALERELSVLRTRDGVYCQRVLRLAPHLRADAGILNIVFRPTVGDVADPAHGSASLSTYYLSRSLMISEQRRRFTRASAGTGATNLRHAANIARRLPEALAFSLWWLYAKRLAPRRMPILFLRRAGGSYPLQFTSEQVPNPASRLVLGAERDPLGMRRMKVLWQASEEDRSTIRAAYRLLRAATDDADGARVAVSEEELARAAEEITPSGGHHIGAARMGATPADGVVDGDLSVWGTRGLYVASAAVFPTSGAANPTLTVVALSLRLADHLIAQLRQAGASRIPA